MDLNPFGNILFELNLVFRSLFEFEFAGILCKVNSVQKTHESHMSEKFMANKFEFYF